MRGTGILLLCMGGLAACNSGNSVPANRAQTGISALSDDSILLPDDAGGFGDSAAGALLESKCTACHSASMVLRQPPLSREQWSATVTKMREAYKAPLREDETAAIVDAIAQIAPFRG